MDNLIDRFSEGPVLFTAALLIGFMFGAAAQHSRFCLRAATIELSEYTLGPRMAIWLLAFFAAVLSVQISEDLADMTAQFITGNFKVTLAIDERPGTL